MTELPNTWSLVKLGDVAKWSSGGTPQAGNPSYYNGDIPWAVIGDLNESKVIDTEKFVTQKGLDASSAKVVPLGTVLLAMYGASIGRTGITGKPMATNQAIATAIVNPELLDSRYLLLYLQSQKPNFVNAGKGGAQPNISQTIIKDWDFALPPLEDQKRIVETLDDHLSRLDKALAELNDGLIACDVFTRSLLKAAFEGQLTNSEENSVWEAARIGDVVDFSPKKPNHLKASKEECSFLPMASVQEVTGVIDLGQTISHEKALAKTLTYFNEGDVLFAKVTPCMENGKIAVARGLTNQMGYGSTEFHVLSPKDSLLADYLRYFLVSKDFRVNAASAMTGAVGLRRVPKSYLEEHGIPLPGLDDQRKVVDTLDFQLSIVEQLKVSMHGHISNIAGLRRSLLHSAFTGKLSEEGISE